MSNNILYCIEHNNSVNYPPPQNQQQQPELQQDLNMVDSMMNFQTMSDLISLPFQPSSPQSPFLSHPQLLDQPVSMETLELLLETTNSQTMELGVQQQTEMSQILEQPTKVQQTPVELTIVEQQTPMEPTIVEQQTPVEPTIVEQQIDTLPQETKEQLIESQHTKVEQHADTLLQEIKEQSIEVQQTPVELTTVDQQNDMLSQEIIEEQHREKENITDLYFEATEGLLECLGEWSEGEDIT